MDAGVVCDGGFSRTEFGKFGTVFTGHFHHKSTDGKIFYLGNTYQITWADYGENRGFHVFDTESQILDFVENPNEMFHKLKYDDSTDEGRSDILQATSSAMQRMIVFPPNVPPQAMKAVRDAIRDFEKDPDYAAEAEKLVGFVPDYETGDDVQEDVRRALTIKDEERDWLMNYAARSGKG
jgi:DNA repair exonuclease SbcCD nuclease subunit